MSNTARIRALYAIFFLSGACGLVYESIWSHYLKMIVGHAAYAQAVVLVVFVGGLALGAWLTGRFSERIARPLLAYALIEALVALAAFLFHTVFVGVSDWSTSWLLPAVCGPEGACHAMWLVAGALILLPSVLLGATFPLMCAGVIRLGVPAGRGLGLLYFSNSAGAVLGVLGSGYLLVPQLGLQGTLLVAGVLNVVVALATYAAARGSLRGDEVPAQAPVLPSGSAPVAPWLLLAAVTGLSSFVYEIAWIRMLTLVLGAATHSFELMLANFILGLALGGWFIRNRTGAMQQPERTLARIQLLMGVLAMATLPIYAGSFDAMALALRALARSQEGFVLYNIAGALLSAAVMLPAAFCAGMTLPLVTSILLARGGGERQIGQVYGFNTLGAIAGVLLSVHLLVPVLGLKWTLLVGALLDVALGAAILWWLARRDAPQRPTALRAAGITAGAAAFACVAFAATTPFGPQQLASGVFRTGLARLQPGAQTLMHMDGRTATITVIENPGGVRTLMTNGKPDGSSDPRRRASTGDDATVTLLGALGPAHHPQARSAAVIGLGTGITSAVLLESPNLRSVETIEIEPLMLQAAQLFRPRNNAAFDDPRSRIVVDDARAYFARSGRKYDLIVSEPSNPWVSGVSGLFTTEFYQRMQGQLADGGHFVQWLHIYESSPELADSILRAFAASFPNFIAYASNPGDIILVGRAGGQAPTLVPAAPAAMPGMAARLADVGITSAALLAAHEVGRSADILPLARSWSSPPNSDYFPYVDSRAFGDRFLGRTANEVFDLRLAPVPVLEFAQGPPPWLGQVRTGSAEMPRHVTATAQAWQGLRYMLSPDASAPGNAAVYTVGRDAIAQCRMPEAGDPAWDALVQVASDTARAMSVADASAIWQPLSHPACARTLTPVQAAWLRLFDAVHARDARAAAEGASQVLELDARMPPLAREYAVLAGVGARLALNDRQEARAMLSRHGTLLPPHRASAPWFRYLAVTASQPG